jgi:hypothetical protein
VPDQANEADKAYLNARDIRGFYAATYFRVPNESSGMLFQLELRAFEYK